MCLRVGPHPLSPPLHSALPLAAALVFSFYFLGDQCVGFAADTADDSAVPRRADTDMASIRCVPFPSVYLGRPVYTHSGSQK